MEPAARSRERQAGRLASNRIRHSWPVAGSTGLKDSSSRDRKNERARTHGPSNLAPLLLVWTRWSLCCCCARAQRGDKEWRLMDREKEREGEGGIEKERERERERERAND